MKRLLLFSNSTNPGQNYMAHCLPPIEEFLGPIRQVTIIPFAGFDRDEYAELIAAHLQTLGVESRSIHQGDAASQIENAQAFYVAGGNTFRLLNQLYQDDLLEKLRAKILAGTPYMGVSAGINIVSPTIMTTNDMPIVEPPSFKALGILPFQLNPHYFDSDPTKPAIGETREKRIQEYLEENATPVLGLREGSWLEVTDDEVTLKGAAAARWFQKDLPTLEISVGERIPQV